MTSIRVSLFLAAGMAAMPSPARAAEPVQDLSALSIEELANLPVRSASKREQPLSEAPTALYVITGEDLASAKVTSLPEALRLAPNLQVQQINAHDYSVSARGFAGYETSNKLLVLVDGRSIYSTLASSVFWDLNTPLVEDLQQIEVISGPGGTLYGPNAVNGVISINSRDARDTTGGLVRGSAGANERTLAGRYGLTLGTEAAVRVYANWFDREDQPNGHFAAADDSIRGWQAGFRADAGADDSRFTLQGDIFRNHTRLIDGDGSRGHNLLARWSGSVSDAATLQVQTYYDYFERRFILVRDALETVDLDTQLNVDAGAHRITTGLGVRTTRDEFVNNLVPFVLTPESRRLWTINGYAQDQVELSDALSLVAGVKLEHSSFSGLQLLPNLRLAWQAGPNALLWGAVSRAVRTPSRTDRDLNYPGLLSRAPGFRSEKLVAFEAGYRGQIGGKTSLSVSLFYNRYDDIRSLELINGVTLPLTLANRLEGSTYGVEIWGARQLLPWWRLSAGLTLLEKDFRVERGAADLSGAAALGDDPPYQVTARSFFNLADGFTLDLSFRAVGALETVDEYVEADARIAWQANDLIELYAAGNNLLHKRHAEVADINRGQLVERSIVAGARLRF